DDSDRPAAAIVLDAYDTLQGLAVDERIVPTSDHRPVVAEGPLARKVELLELGVGRIDVAANKTVACIENLSNSRLPPHADVETLGLRMGHVVFQRCRSGPCPRQS